MSILNDPNYANYTGPTKNFLSSKFGVSSTATGVLTANNGTVYTNVSLTGADAGDNPSISNGQGIVVNAVGSGYHVLHCGIFTTLANSCVPVYSAAAGGTTYYIMAKNNMGNATNGKNLRRVYSDTYLSSLTTAQQPTLANNIVN